MIRVTLAWSLAAAGLWFYLFSPLTRAGNNLWLAMCASTALLAGAGLYNSRADAAQLYAWQPRYLYIGVAAAACLYGIFLAGNIACARILPFAGSQVAHIYSIRGQAHHGVIAALLLFWIGPAEEIFWRGMVQAHLAKRLGSTRGFLAASLLYAGVHIFSGNFMLICAALVCGIFWGLMFKRFGCLWPGIISHGLWSATIFAVLPIK